jgi:hypothetical protein
MVAAFSAKRAREKVIEECMKITENWKDVSEYVERLFNCLRSL